jgi:hypothetical protein
VANAEQAISARLRAFAGLTALVGTKIYPVVMPQGTVLPAVTYRRTAGPRVQNLAGSSGLARPVIAVDVFAASYSSAKAIGEQVRLALSDQGGSWGSCTVQNCVFLGDRDVADDLEQEAPSVYRVSLEFEVWHAETRAAA